MEFTLVLREKRVKGHQVTAMHLTSGLAFLGAGAIISVYNFEIKAWGFVLLVASLILLTVTVVRNRWLAQPANSLIFRYIELALSFTLLIYSVFQQWNFPIVIFGILSAALIFSIFWERAGNSTQSVIVSEGGVLLNVGSFSKKIPWVNVEQVLYRHGTLSVDCADNTLYQWNISPQNIDALDLEAYCMAQVEIHRANRKAVSDW